MNFPSPARAPISRARALARVVVCALAVLAAGELALRAAEFSPSVVPHRIVLLGDDEDRALERGEGLLQFDAAALWTLRPGAPIPWAPDERVSASGLCGVEPPLGPVPGTLRVAVLGGSAACGVGVSYAESFSGRLAGELEALGVPCDVVCAAVPRASIRQSLAHWRATASAFRPDVVVYATARGLGWEPAVDRLTDEQKILYLARHPERWRTPELGRGVRVLEVWPWLVAVADGSYWRQRYAAMEARRSELMSFSGEDPSVRRVSPGDLLQCLDDLASETAAAGAELVVLTVPRDPDGPEARLPAALAYQGALADWLRASGTATVNGREAYATALRDEGLERGAFFLEDDLPTPLAHACLARALARQIASSRGDR